MVTLGGKFPCDKTLNPFETSPKPKWHPLDKPKSEDQFNTAKSLLKRFRDYPQNKAIIVYLIQRPYMLELYTNSV